MYLSWLRIPVPRAVLSPIQATLDSISFTALWSIGLPKCIAMLREPNSSVLSIEDRGIMTSHEWYTRMTVAQMRRQKMNKRNYLSLLSIHLVTFNVRKLNEMEQQATLARTIQIPKIDASQNVPYEISIL